MKLHQAEALVELILMLGAERKSPPLTVSVVDASGTVVVLKRQDGSPLIRPEFATGKARTCLYWGASSKAYGKFAAERPIFASAASACTPMPLIPAGGGVAILSKEGVLLGAVGVSGDTSENDEAIAIAAIEQLEL